MDPRYNFSYIYTPAVGGLLIALSPLMSVIPCRRCWLVELLQSKMHQDVQLRMRQKSASKSHPIAVTSHLHYLQDIISTLWTLDFFLFCIKLSNFTNSKNSFPCTLFNTLLKRLIRRFVWQKTTVFKRGLLGQLIVA